MVARKFTQNNMSTASGNIYQNGFAIELWYKVDAANGTLGEAFDLRLGELTDEERQIILKGCLINYNRV